MTARVGMKEVSWGVSWIFHLDGSDVFVVLVVLAVLVSLDLSMVINCKSKARVVN